MRYLYYIAGIIILISGLAAYEILGTKVKISKPAVIVNDRIITESEMKDRIKNKPYYMNSDEYIDSIITEQLLIQEAVGQNIHKEESFRLAVEQYYEQSLIKILLDRKLAGLEVKVTPEEIQKYKQLAGSKVLISKFGFSSLEKATEGPYNNPKQIESEFEDLADALKFIILDLAPGTMSAPVDAGMSITVYRLENTTPLPSSQTAQYDSDQIKQFILDQKREQLMEEWTRKLKENAEIWRKK